MPGHYHHSDSVVEIVFTFDDGPHAAKKRNRTKLVMDVLRFNRLGTKMKGIFFIQTHSRGKDWIWTDSQGKKRRTPTYFRGNTDIGKELIKTMHKRGHIIGIHTGHDVEDRDHIPHTDRTPHELRDDIDRASTFIETVLAEPLKGKPYLPKLIRAVGRKNVPKKIEQIYHEKFYKLTGWDVDSEDSRPDATPESVKKALVTHTWAAIDAGKKRLIVLFHDTDDYISYDKLEKNLEDYLEVIKLTIEGKADVLRNRFSLDVKTLEGIERTKFTPKFVDERDRLAEIVRWKYWGAQDDPSEIREIAT